MLVGAGYRDSSFKGFSSDPELVAGRQAYYNASVTTHNILLARQRRYRDFSAKDLSARAELSGRLETGAVTHHMLLGVDTYDYQLDQVQNRFRPTLANPERHQRVQPGLRTGADAAAVHQHAGEAEGHRASTSRTRST